ncbi:pentatricopeptide repeat-containing protein [Senna tora]|uniref:Pentatricopeptide repeat-containing protein n=1 Tax=Senna tora TaxID=362788 RepID=A0A834SRZ0_9FABA|nr:pentatricopeptide repeat-containing protein [Senna tora]
MYFASVRTSSFICCQSLRLRNFHSPSASPHLERTRNFQHREQYQGFTRLSDFDIIIAKVSKGRSEDEILKSLVNDLACDEINLSHDLIDRLLHRFKDDWKSAFGIFKWASMQSGFRHSPETYDMMIDILGKMKQWNKVRALLKEMNQGCLITLNTIAKVMRRFTGSGHWEDALRVFDEIETFRLEKNTESMNVLLDTLCKENYVEQARAIFLELKQHISPNAHTFNIFIHGWCKVRRVDEAHWTIQEMKGHGFYPSVISYSTIIQCYCREQNFSRAYEVLDEMQAQGCSPNVITFTGIIFALAKAQKVDEAFDILKQMEDSGLCKPNVQTYHPLIKLCFKTGNIDSCLNDVLDDMINKHHLGLDISTYTLIIHGLLRANRCEWAYSMFEEMINQDILPRYKTCRLLLDEVKLNSMYEAAEKIEDLMRKL